MYEKLQMWEQVSSFIAWKNLDISSIFRYYAQRTIVECMGVTVHKTKLSKLETKV